MRGPAADEVHVWLVSVARAASVADLLDDGERERADRFRFERSRLLYTTAHGGLRSVLGRYLHESPRSLCFELTPMGKPRLAEPFDAALEFNLSHSGSLAMIAVARGRAVGVDVERSRMVRSEEAVARRVMTPDELDRYLALKGSDRLDFLLWVWARKEALVKASGDGIRGSLRTLPCEPGPGDQWAVTDLPVPGYAAAVAAWGHDWSPVLHELPDPDS